MSKRKLDDWIQAIRTSDTATIESFLQEQEEPARKLLRALVHTYWTDVALNLLSFPNEILVMILQYLDPLALIPLRLVCKKFCECVQILARGTHILDIPPATGLLAHYPCVQQLCVTLYSTHKKLPTVDFFEQLTQCSQLWNLCFRLDRSWSRNYSAATPENALATRSFCFPSITRLCISFPRDSCFCFLLKGLPMKPSLSLHSYFPNLVDFSLEHTTLSSHVPRCKLLTLLRRSISKLETLQIGLPTERHMMNALSSHYLKTLSRIFYDKSTLRMRLCTFRCFYPVTNLFPINLQLPHLSALELAAPLDTLFRHGNSRTIVSGPYLQSLERLTTITSKCTCTHHVRLLDYHQDFGLDLFAQVHKEDRHSHQINRLSTAIHTLSEAFRKNWKLVFYCYVPERHAWILQAFQQCGISVEIR